MLKKYSQYNKYFTEPKTVPDSMPVAKGCIRVQKNLRILANFNSFLAINSCKYFDLKIYSP